MREACEQAVQPVLKPLDAVEISVVLLGGAGLGLVAGDLSAPLALDRRGLGRDSAGRSVARGHRGTSAPFEVLAVYTGIARRSAVETYRIERPRSRAVQRA